MSNNDRRLIEDLIPIREISAEASREKSLRHGNISTLHHLVGAKTNNCFSCCYLWSASPCTN